MVNHNFENFHYYYHQLWYVSKSFFYSLLHLNHTCTKSKQVYHSKVKHIHHQVFILYSDEMPHLHSSYLVPFLLKIQSFFQLVYQAFWYHWIMELHLFLFSCLSNQSLDLKYQREILFLFVIFLFFFLICAFYHQTYIIIQDFYLIIINN